MKGYTRYFRNRILWYLLTFAVALVLNFVLPRLMPGNPVASIAAGVTESLTDQKAAAEMMEEYTRAFGLDKSLPEQFFVFLGNLLKGDLGVSFRRYPTPVVTILKESVPWTIALQLPAILTGWMLGNLLGAIAAYRRGVFDRAIFPAFLFVGAFPSFGLAIILLFVFGIMLRLLPTSGGYGFDLIPGFNLQFIASAVRHYQLPFWSIVLNTIGGQAIGMRSMSIYELNADYVKYSRFLGIRDRRIVGYVFRNAMLPQVTGLALSLGTMVGGALVAETIFSYPGIGSTVLASIKAQDYPMISGATLFITIGVLLANLVIEILYGFIDPRIKANQQE